MDNAPTKPQDVVTSDFVNAMASAAMGVSVVTTNGPAGRLGLTVSAWSSVSAEPPIVLVCINRKNPIVEAITRHRAFVVNALDVNHVELARIFSGHPKTGAPYHFADRDWVQSDTGEVLLQGASATFSCNLESHVDIGTHRVFMGRVHAVSKNTATPLIYHNRTFGRFDPLT